MQADKSATNYQNTVKEVKALQGGAVESILNMVDDFNKPTLYDTLNSYIRDIKKWEKDETLAKLYKPW